MNIKVSRILLIVWGMLFLALSLSAQPALMDASSNKPLYSIEWHLNGGVQNKANPDSYTSEDGLILASPTRDGFTFNGWFANADLSGAKITAIAKGETKKKVFYAGWVITKEQAIKIIQKEMVTVIPAGKKVFLDDFAGTEGTQTINAYQIAKHEVTQELYMALMGNNPSFFKNNAANGEVQEKRPVEQVSWYNACDFCNKLSEIMGLTPCYDKNYNCNYFANGFRLPTEAEWEMAARGGVAGGWDYKYSGSDRIDEVAWFYKNSKATHEVGKKKANALGLYDMSGNVCEWCDSKYESSVFPSVVVRGGSLDFFGGYGISLCAVSYRFYNDPLSRNEYSGFRLVRSLQ